MNPSVGTDVAKNLYWLKGSYSLDVKSLPKFTKLIGVLCALCSFIFLLQIILGEFEPPLWRPLIGISLIYVWAEHGRRNLRTVEVSEAGIKVEPLGLTVSADNIDSIERKKHWKKGNILEVKLKSPKLYFYMCVWAYGKRLTIGLD